MNELHDVPPKNRQPINEEMERRQNSALALAAIRFRALYARPFLYDKITPEQVQFNNTAYR